MESKAGQVTGIYTDNYTSISKILSSCQVNKIEDISTSASVNIEYF